MRSSRVTQPLWAGVPALLGTMHRRLGRPILRVVAYPLTSRWRPYSHLFLGSAPWTIFWDMHELAAIARRIGICVADWRWLRYAQNQAVFYGGHSVLGEREWSARSSEIRSHRVGIAYFHGRPGTGVPGFDEWYQQLCRNHHQIHRVQVSHSEMREVVLSSGIAPEKVFLIPIGVNLSYFHVQTPETRRKVRAQLGIPESAIVVGSFQKDGVGWGEGLEPKLVKGPDVFLKAIELLKPRIPELFVLLSGPARGYIKAGLEQLGVPYRHYFLKHYPEVGRLFQALDVYIVASRQEGGPKAVLEAMASGVPLVTTRVGQAMDLVRHGENGWMVEVEDAEGLVHWAEYVISHRSSLSDVLRNGRQMAEANSYEAQIPLWKHFMRGFVEWEE